MTERFKEDIALAGGRVYEVGGCVRDSLLGRKSKDTDYLVCNLPFDSLNRILERHGRTNLVGKSFGVIKFTVRGVTYDISLPRTEVSTGPGHRDFQVCARHDLPVEADLGRRDFTINAIARDAITGEIVDPFGGQEDVRVARLKMVSPTSFREDPLRMLRGVQFAARLALEIEPETRTAMGQQASLIETVSPERISTEIVKLLSADRPSSGFRVMRDTGLLGRILPELEALIGIDQPPEYHLFDAFDHSLEVCDRVPWKRRIDLRLAALFHDLGKKATRSVGEDGRIHFHGHAPVGAELAQDVLIRLKFMAVEGADVSVDRIVDLIRHHMFGCTHEHPDRIVRRFVSRVGKELVMDQIRLRIGDRLGGARPDVAPWFQLARRVRIVSQGAVVAFDQKSLAISGRDIMKAGVPQGPLVGRVLARLLDRVIDDPALNVPESLLGLLPEIIEEEST